MPLQYRNFKAWIYCENDGDILEEYKPEQDPEDERIYTCWVASEVGKRFTVHWESLMKAVCDNKGVTFVDGVETHSYVNIVASGKDGASNGVKLETGEIRPYSFSDVVLTDDDAYLDVAQSADADELGNITLKIYLVHARMVHRPWTQQHHGRPRHNREISLYDGAIHERTKKICDHRITLGDAIPFGPPRRERPNSKKLVWEPVDRNDPDPHVIFRFKYRPRAYLQAQGIIPSPVIATPPKPTIANAEIYLEGDLEKQKKRKRPLGEQSHSQRNVKHEGLNSSFPLFLPTPTSLHDLSRPAPDDDIRNVRPVFIETPASTIDDDDDVIILEYTKRGRLESNGAHRRNGHDATVKRERETSVKVETGGMVLWMDNRGVIDLTRDD